MNHFRLVIIFMTIVLLVLFLGIIGIALSLYGSRIKRGMSTISMYNISVCLIVASIISGVISFWAVYLALPGSNTQAISQQEVIVDIFSVLVTVLMGWNIISVVDIKRNAEKVNSVSNDLEIVISRMIDLNFHSFTLRKDREAVIHYCFEMMNAVQECDNRIIKKTAEVEIVKMLTLIKNSYREQEQIFIYEKERNRYLFILSQAEGVYTDNVERMIKEAKEKGLSKNGDSVDFNDKTQDNLKTSDNSNMQFNS